jgi:hypothetical protein
MAKASASFKMNDGGAPSVPSPLAEEGQGGGYSELAFYYATAGASP